MKQPHIMKEYGPLDLWLAKKRYRTAQKLIAPVAGRRRILDIGCGSYPLFLITTNFAEKYGLDKDINTGMTNRMRQHGIHLSQHRIEGQERLPFEDNFFDVVSMLAVFEHIEPGLLVGVHREVYRVLKPGGMYVMTTPAVWTGGILWLLGKLRLISGNISEHKGSYNRSMVFPVLQEAGFEKGSLKFGLFELFMNTWTTAVK